MESSPTSLSTAILFFFFPSKYKKAECGGGAGCSCRAPPASPPASFPASPGPLSSSRAAAHMVPCQIPGGSGGHVSGSLPLHRPRVTMETAANGKPALPAGAEPSAAGAGGAGAGPRRGKMRAGPGSHPHDPGGLKGTGRPPGLSVPHRFGNISPAFPRHSWDFLCPEVEG